MGVRKILVQNIYMKLRLEKRCNKFRHIYIKSTPTPATKPKNVLAATAPIDFRSISVGDVDEEAAFEVLDDDVLEVEVVLEGAVLEVVVDVDCEDVVVVVVGNAEVVVAVDEVVVALTSPVNAC